MTNEEIAIRWAQGLTSDFSLLDEVSSPTMMVWHSTDGAWIGREESTRRAAELERVGRPEFENVRSQVTERGFVVQATLVDPAHEDRSTHIVQLVTVQSGLVTHVEEYIAPGRRSDPR